MPFRRLPAMLILRFPATPPAVAGVLDVQGGDDDLLLVDVVPLHLLDDPAFEHDEDAVAVVDELLGVTGVQQHRGSLSSSGRG